MANIIVLHNETKPKLGISTRVCNGKFLKHNRKLRSIMKIYRFKKELTSFLCIWAYKLITSSNTSIVSMLGYWMVYTTILFVWTIFFTAHMMTAIALASRPEVGSSMDIMDGLETSFTAIVSRFFCSFDIPLVPRIPTKASLISWSSISWRILLRTRIMLLDSGICHGFWSPTCEF